MLTSFTRHLNRLLDNTALGLCDWYKPISRQWVTVQVNSGKQIRLIVDGTKIEFTYQHLMVSLAY